MKLWKRNAVVAAIVLFVCVAVYLNWSYQKESVAGVDGRQGENSGKVLGQAALVNGTADPLLTGKNPSSDEGLNAGEDQGSDSAEVTPPASASTGYFATARLNRQQARDSALAMLRDAVNDETNQETAREEAGAAIETLASSTVSEAQIENLVIAKGYQDCVAFISGGGVSVVVSATEEGLQAADVARITEIVTGETGVPASQIKIIEAEG